MKLRELIVMEDGEGGGATAGATTSSDIATVAYPLFVRGRSKKDKRKNARAAVGQKYIPGPLGIGQGVFEELNELSNTDQESYYRFLVAKVKTGRTLSKQEKEFIKTYQFYKMSVAEGSLNEFAPGSGGDDDGDADPYKYPKPESYRRSIDFFGKFEADHFDREDFDDATGVFKGYWGKTQIAYFKFNDPTRTGSDDPGMGWYYEPESAGSAGATAAPAVDNSAQRKQQELGMIDAFLKSGQTPKPGTQIYSLMKRHGMAEAHVLNHDNVIYRLDRDNPMSDTEVLVLGGAGRYSLKALRDKARREAAALAQDLSIEHGGAFRRSATNIKQLTNTINTIVAAYNELARLRRKGGRGSRGITDEDANFIRECIRVVEQATQNYRLMEARAVEPDSQGYVKDKLTNPKYTVVVNTPGDLDWYKIGMYWHDKVVDPHEFGQDDSDTVMVAQGPEEYKEMMAKIKQMGLTYKEIGGTTDQPEIHSKTY